MAAASIILYISASYLSLGLVFAVVFVLRGIASVDPATRGGSRWFRVLIIPGVAAFWPVLAWRWWKASNVKRPS